MSVHIEISRGGNHYMKVEILSSKNQAPDNLDFIVDKLRRDYRWVDGFIVKAVKVTTKSVEVCER